MDLVKRTSHPKTAKGKADKKTLLLQSPVIVICH